MQESGNLFRAKTREQVLIQKRVYMEDGKTEVPVLVFPLLEQTGIVDHCFTTRGGGVSRGIYSSMNLSFTRGDAPDAVLENFRRVARVLGSQPEDFVCSDQTHTTNVRRVTRADGGKGLVREKDYKDVDGLITDEPGLVLATFYADCVPLYFADPVHHAIGLSHSGWRGTAGRMGQVTLSAMQREFGTNPQEVYCAVGPSICQDCYEVSEDVAQVFRQEFGHSAEKLWLDKGNGRYQLDLWKANAEILLEAGVEPGHLAVTNLCTCCNSSLLFSHRASHGKRGNLGAFLKLKL